MKVEQARGETVRPSLETRARALGLNNKEELQRLQWATTKKVNRASRTEEQVEADMAKRRILDKERKDKYKATVSDLYDKSSRVPGSKDAARQGKILRTFWFEN